MKKNFYLYSIVLIAMFIGSLQAKAQEIDMNSDQVVWKGSTIDQLPTFSQDVNAKHFYMIAYKQNLSAEDPEKLINNGGKYGVQGMLTTIGIRMQIQQVNGNNYRICTRIGNVGRVNGWCLGGDDKNLEVFLDRNEENNQGNKTQWRFTREDRTHNGVRYYGEEGNKNEGVITYTIKWNNGDWWLGVDEAGCLITVNNVNNATRWIFVTDDDYLEAMDKLTWGQVDLGSFVKDGAFNRDNMDARYWVWSDAVAPAEIRTEGDWITDYEGQYMTPDDWKLTDDPIHWHQRNQNLMINGIVCDQYYDDQHREGVGNYNTYSIPAATIGNNIYLDHIRQGNGNPLIVGYVGAIKPNYNWDDIRTLFGEYYCGEIYNEQIKLSQQVEMDGVENLKSGLYKVTVQAFYDDDRDEDEATDGTTNDDVAYIFIETETDGVKRYQELPIIPVNKIEENVGKGGFDGGNIVTRHSGLSAGYLFNNNPKAGLHEFYVELAKTSKLTMGIFTKKAEGWTVFGNVHFYALGKEALFLDENWTNNETITIKVNDKERELSGDPYQFSRFHEGYEFPVTLYYKRTFTLNAWNPIVLPLNLTTAQVRTAFGDDVKVSEFVGLNGTDDTVIKFTKSETFPQEGLKARVPYLIKPTKSPDLAEGETAELQIGNGGSRQEIIVEGPIYYIGGVTKAQANADDYVGEAIAPPTEVTCGNTGITYAGTFYKKVIQPNEIWGQNNLTGEHNYWVITKGNMYHLTGASSYNIWNTYCYIYDKDNTFRNEEFWTKRWADNANTFTISIDGVEDVATRIEGLYIEGNDNQTGVYNVNGQYMGRLEEIDNLPKGIYVVNGKKLVVK